jgi:RHS repeat-associated protein
LGYYWDGEVARFTVRRRAYSPAIGRWLSTDFGGYSSSRTVNPFSYLLGRPTYTADPSGGDDIGDEEPPEEGAIIVTLFDSSCGPCGYIDWSWLYSLPPGTGKAAVVQKICRSGIKDLCRPDPDEPDCCIFLKRLVTKCCYYERLEDIDVANGLHCGDHWTGGGTQNPGLGCNSSGYEILTADVRAFVAKYAAVDRDTKPWTEGIKPCGNLRVNISPSIDALEEEPPDWWDDFDFSATTNGLSLWNCCPGRSAKSLYGGSGGAGEVPCR